MKGFNPACRVLSGDVLIASILACGNGRPGSPRKFSPYWSIRADRLNPPRIECASAREACAEVAAWARRYFPEVRIERCVRC
jgi:hypothetical protein